MKIVKYPRVLSTAEITGKNLLLELADNNDIILTKTNTELSGIYPYLFDTLNYIATHKRPHIEEKGNYYEISIKWKRFYEFACGPFIQDNKSRLLKEMYKLIKNNTKKVIPIGKGQNGHYLTEYTSPLLLDIMYTEHKRPFKISGLKHIKENMSEGITIMFYKPLWESIVNQKPNRYFFAPANLHTILNRACQQYENTPEILKHGEIGKAINYRRLFLYLNAHDNQRGNHINYNAVHLARSCFPSVIRKRKNQYEITSWKQFYNYIQPGLLLFNRLFNDNLLKGSQIVPKSATYDRLNQSVKIDYYRISKAHTTHTAGNAPFLNCDNHSEKGLFV